MLEYLSERDVLDLASRVRVRVAEDEVAQMASDLNAIIEGLQPAVESALSILQEGSDR